MKQAFIPGVGGAINGLIVDLFCCAGGASQGLERGVGRAPDIACNHDPEAIEYHRRNHPATEHYLADVWEVDPRQACAGRNVGWLHGSPDCTYFSRAKGAKPLRDAERRVRSLAWVIVKWAALVRPTVISLENVPEFVDWGPVRRGRPVRKHRGRYFRQFCDQLRSLGYQVEYRNLVASHYGAATSRERLFLVARCDGRPITWPRRTHGHGTRRAERTAAEIIDWSLPCPSIFLPAAAARRLRIKRPLAIGTCERIAKGVMRYVVNDQAPFLIPGSAPAFAGERQHQVAAFIAKHYGGVVGHRPDDRPLGAITTIDHHSLVTCRLAERTPMTAGTPAAAVAAFLTKYYGTGSQSQSLREPLHTIVTKPRFGVVTCALVGAEHQIVDIGLRMLQPHELAAAQGFAPGYHLPSTKDKATYFIGHSVCPDPMAALVRANLDRRHAIAA